MSSRTAAVLDHTLTGPTRNADKPGLFAATGRMGTPSVLSPPATGRTAARLARPQADPAPPRRQMPLRCHALDRPHEPIAAMLAAEHGLAILLMWERPLDERDAGVSWHPRRVNCPGESQDSPGQFTQSRKSRIEHQAREGQIASDHLTRRGRA